MGKGFYIKTMSNQGYMRIHADNLDLFGSGRADEAVFDAAGGGASVWSASTTIYQGEDGAMNVSLTPELEKKIEEKIATGLYSSASEVVREALRLLFQVDEARQKEIADINRRIRRGVDQIDRGEGIPGREARRRSHRRLAKRNRG